MRTWDWAGKGQGVSLPSTLHWDGPGNSHLSCSCPCKHTHTLTHTCTQTHVHTCAHMHTHAHLHKECPENKKPFNVSVKMRCPPRPFNYGCKQSSATRKQHSGDRLSGCQEVALILISVISVYLHRGCYFREKIKHSKLIPIKNKN